MRRWRPRPPWIVCSSWGLLCVDWGTPGAREEVHARPAALGSAGDGLARRLPTAEGDGSAGAHGDQREGSAGAHAGVAPGEAVIVGDDDRGDGSAGVARRSAVFAADR